MNLMINFKIDYAVGAHPNILKCLYETNLLHTAGYGEDPFCQEAIECLRQRLEALESDIHFLVGETQTNLTFISHTLKSYEAVLSATTGHIAFNETGAIEVTGHKVITLPSRNGKVTLEQLKQTFTAHHGVHMVKPKLLYLSNPTELGTLYSKEELITLSTFCKEHNLYLYIDGARLGSALVSSTNTISLADYAKLTDAFYIGGTKNGALFGEALVINHTQLKEDFRLSMKQHGALLAKGRLLGIQFLELFKDNLYYTLAAHANTMANLLQEGLKSLNIPFFVETTTNQLFPIFSYLLIDDLSSHFSFQIWGGYDQHHAIVRLVTSFTTSQQDVHDFLCAVSTFMNKATSS